MSDLTEAILLALIDLDLTVPEIAQVSGLNPRDVQDGVEVLTDQGKIETVEPDLFRLTQQRGTNDETSEQTE